MDYYKENRKKQLLRRKFETKLLIINLKNNPCVDCGGRFEHYQMDFLKRDGVKMINLLIKSKKTVIEEISKCELLCANCSRKRFWFSQREKRSGPS